MLASLPDRLQARSRLVVPANIGAGSYVMYWMRTGVRAHENAALDVAIILANQADVPLFVYHALSERYPYASDRHHRFILEGARDVAAELSGRGIASVFHLERPGHRGPHLRTLALDALAVVTEDMPVAPLRGWTRALAESVDTPVVAVDTATVVPMRQVGKGVDRAFAYRKRIQPHLERALEPWPEQSLERSSLPPLPFEPVDLTTLDFASAIASCQIDHTVPPVFDTPGGSVAGYARWSTFRDAKLPRYAADRNDPVLNGSSRMSAYLHYGMVAPTRLAREARGLPGAGPAKFIDELVVWRELAYTWCLFARHHDTLDALPEWARETLLAHTNDPRAYQPGSEKLHLGRTGDTLWDLAQRSLLWQGELHNNVRMTWGKALIPWTATSERALSALVDLNHRYALDGRDPGSYGGLLWCLGQFDRPFPEGPVWGTVRSRSLSRHAKRIDLDSWQRALKPARRTVAIIGAGLAGSFCGHVLTAAGAEVQLFDKGRGAGGRLSARRRDDHVLLHGAPELHISDPRLRRWVAGWVEAGAAEATDSGTRSHPPNRLVKHLQRHSSVHFNTRIVAMRHEAGWILESEDGAVHGPFDDLVLTVPAPQAIPLLGEHPFARALEAVTYAPCWVALLTFDTAQPALEPSGAIARIVGSGTGLTFHASASWSEMHLESEPDVICAALVEEVRALGFDAPVCSSAHRWRYARVVQGMPGDALFDSSTNLVLAGDLFAGGEANGALLSGAAAAGHLLGRQP